MEARFQAGGLKGAGAQQIQKHTRRNHWAHRMR